MHICIQSLIGGSCDDFGVCLMYITCTILCFCAFEMGTLTIMGIVCVLRTMHDVGLILNVLGTKHKICKYNGKVSKCTGYILGRTTGHVR